MKATMILACLLTIIIIASALACVPRFLPGKREHLFETSKQFAAQGLATLGLTSVT